MRNVRRFYVPNTIVFITLVTKHRRTLFDVDHPHHVEIFFDKLRAVREVKPFKLLAHNFLPDHVHMLLRPTGEATFSSILQSAQRSFTFEYKDRYGIQGSLHLWQHRFWDHLIRDEEDLNRHFDYTHWNAVKHGLVARPEDWPFSSHEYWLEKGYYEVGWGHATPASLEGADDTEFGE
ncbi:MAG: transposase [Anaerolineae bacterium]|jgi:putative transposase